ncbi:MAG: Dyp-type peroxidase, partial [Pseudomonadota bacterium]|nr:Dyp-type peroxidase [Pseudomonadota bacterium]
MARSQSAILPESGSAGLFLVLRVAEGDAATREVVRRCAGLEQMGAALVDEAVEGEPAPALRASVAFGADFWDRLSPHSRPALLKRFKPLRGAYDAPATGGDVFIHLHSLRPDLNFELAKRLLEELN